MIILSCLAFKGSGCEEARKEEPIEGEALRLPKVDQHVRRTHSSLFGGSLETLELMGKPGITCQEVGVLILALLSLWV